MFALFRLIYILKGYKKKKIVFKNSNTPPNLLICPSTVYI